MSFSHCRSLAATPVKTTVRFTSIEFRRWCRSALATSRRLCAQQSVRRHRDEHRQVDQGSSYQRRVRMVGEIRRRVGEMFYIDEVEQERRADHRENRREKFALQRDWNQEDQRIVEVSLVHPRREHEKSE